MEEDKGDEQLKTSAYRDAYSESSFWEKSRSTLKSAGREVIEKALILYFVLQDKETPMMAKATIIGALGYFISPLDGIPDITPLIGYSDDASVLAAAFTAVATNIKESHRRRAAEKLARWFS